MKTGKKRLYAPSQEALDIIKGELKSLGIKSNNTQAVNYAVYVLSKMIQEDLININKQK